MSKGSDGQAAGEVSLSNRRETSPFFGADGVGIDRLSLSFPVHEFEQDRSAWTREQVRNPGTPDAASTLSGSVDLGDGVRAFVGVQEVPATGQVVGKIELNPARVVDPDGHSLATVEVLPTAVAAAWAAAADLVAPACGPEDARVKRLDVARDFHGVERPDFYLRGLAPVKRPWARKNLVHFDPARKGAQTLMVGSGAGVVRLYDKHAETSGQVPPGTLRWEAECRSDWSKRYGDMRSLGDINCESVDRLALNRWEWSAMGVEVTATERVVEKVQRSGLSPAKQRAFLGFLLMRSVGAESPMSNDTATEFNRLVRTLGVTLDAGEPAGPAFVGRLDFEAGTEVLRAA